ncbi:hypothetical protein [Halomonas chromatireducens]|uniref:Uncharacterized protein n=1 Tax=Halomonas chromatireducens TaxID=507626 RepID=A0A120JVX9_9GAMM|nr:hypothetical protein [Halomonas chromatireducens]AMD00578.1 hypothetical protein LOKO_01510 [Halomonas chromatireducens]
MGTLRKSQGSRVAVHREGRHSAAKARVFIDLLAERLRREAVLR